MTTRVVVLGSNGMLGHQVMGVLGQVRALDVVGLNRSNLNAADATLGALANWLGGADYVINCIGVTKPRIDERQLASVDQAIAVNAAFPYRLAFAAQKTGTRVIQIATDCVFTGRTGGYFEDDRHNADDVYGRSKSLGEVIEPHVLLLRCSIIGPELGRAQFLWEWVSRQPEGAHVPAFTHHRWNGVTTLAFARICGGLIRAGETMHGVQHLVPADAVDKATLLVHIAAALGRQDLQFELKADGPAVDRRLATLHRERNHRLWELGGYDQAPSIESLVQGVVEWSR